MCFGEFLGCFQPPAESKTERGIHPIPVFAVVIENCSRANEKIQRMTLSDLSLGLVAADGPVLVMLGDALKSRIQEWSARATVEARAA